MSRRKKDEVSHIDVTRDGENYSATFTVHGGFEDYRLRMVKVMSEIGTRSRQTGGLPPKVVASHLLSDMIGEVVRANAATKPTAARPH